MILLRLLRPLVRGRRQGGSTIREIYSTELRIRRIRELFLRVQGSSSSYMVRKMVGTLLDVGRGRLSPQDIDRLYELKDRSSLDRPYHRRVLCMVFG